VLAALVVALSPLWAAAQQATAASPAGTASPLPELRVGVLAHRGWASFEHDWEPLARYLDARLSSYVVRLVPVTLSSAVALIDQGGLDFLVTNPGHYVALSRTHHPSVLATRARRLPGGGISTEFGSAIVVRAHSLITEIEDVTGTRVAAVDPRAFGGFRVGWEAFDRLGLDLFDIAEELRFLGFPQDRIVLAVLAGEVDVGIVRSGLLERMVAEGLVSEDALRVLNSNVTFTHPEAVSTRLYPEWPFLALPGTPREARDAVALALLLTARDAPDLPQLWSAPVNYHAAHELEATFEAARARLSAPTGAARWGLLVALAGSATGIVLLMAWTWRAGAPRSAAPIPAPIPAGTAPAMAAEPPRPVEAVPLTRRERQVLDGIAQGLSTKEIALALGISPKTVEFHRSNLLRKFDARSAAQLVGLARIHET